MRGWALAVCGAVAGVSGWLLSGCEVGSPDEVVAGVGNSFAGYYANSGGLPLVSNNSGSPIVALTLQQDGNQIQAVDNNGQLFSGTLAENGQSNVVNFNMSGPTTAGAAGTMSGTIAKSGTTATMSGTWAEPSMFGSIYGTATVPAAPTNSTPVTNSTPTNFTTGLSATLAP